MRSVTPAGALFGFDTPLLVLVHLGGGLQYSARFLRNRRENRKKGPEYCNA